jgi:hypothetical protein
MRRRARGSREQYSGREYRRGFQVRMGLVEMNRKFFCKGRNLVQGEYLVRYEQGRVRSPSPAEVVSLFQVQSIFTTQTTIISCCLVRKKLKDPA